MFKLRIKDYVGLFLLLLLCAATRAMRGLQDPVGVAFPSYVKTSNTRGQKKKKENDKPIKVMH